MARIVHNHENPTALIPGAIGQPGEREFFLQVVSPDNVTTLACDKSQVAALADKCQEMLEQLQRSKEIDIGLLTGYVNPEIPPLVFPLTQEFEVGLMGIAYLPGSNRINFEAQEYREDSSLEIYSSAEVADMEDAPEILQASFTILAIRKFIVHARALVSAGRKSCPFCGLPINSDGHLCPRANGYRR
jgi:uncharacterized repeat protein (TIGR03847 family)